MSEAWIIDCVRSPRAIGKPGRGAYDALHPQNLLASVLQALAARNALDTRDVDDVIIGCGLAAGEQGYDIGRLAQLAAGWDVLGAGITVSRYCGSGMSAVNMAAASIMAGMEDLVVAGGVEKMSYTSTLPPIPMDCGNLELRRRWPQPHQGISADLIATIEGATREELDAIGLESQRRTAVAIDEGRFDRSVVPVHAPDGTLLLDHEEYPRPGTTMDDLAAIRPAFAKLIDMPLCETGMTHRELVRQAFPDVEVANFHHAGNSSGVVDGAAAIILASPDYARAQGWKPRARIRGMANIGGNPTLMLNEPGPATRKALARTGMEISDIDLFEVNEAFAVVVWKFMRDLSVDPAICNVNGGSIALGHPIGATGAILVGTLLDELERRDLTTGLATMCAGGGQAPAIIIERV